MSAKNYTKNRIQAFKIYKDRGMVKFTMVFHFWFIIIWFLFVLPLYSHQNPINDDTVNLWERTCFDKIYPKTFCANKLDFLEILNSEAVFASPNYSLKTANPNAFLLNVLRYWWISASTFWWFIWEYGFESTEASNARLSGVTLYENRDQSVHSLSKELDHLMALEALESKKISEKASI